MDELAVPEGLHERILRATLGTTEVKVVKRSFAAAWMEWVRGLRFPLPVPQLAPVALLLLIAFMVFGQTVSANGSITDVYQKGFELAEQTYLQSADAWNGNSSENQIQKQEPTNGTTYVTNEEQKQ
jgi:hypothetical protein